MSACSQVTAGLGVAVLDMMQEIQKSTVTFAIPFLMFWGTSDELINRTAAESFYNGAQSKDKSMFKVEGSQHETLRDKDREMVIGRIKDWILERCAQ